MKIERCSANPSVRRKAENHFTAVVAGYKRQPIRYYRLSPSGHIIATRWDASTNQRYVRNAELFRVPRIDVSIAILSKSAGEFKPLGTFTLNWTDRLVYFGKPVFRLPVDEWGEELVLHGTRNIRTPKGRPLLDLWGIAMEHAREVARLKGLRVIGTWARRKGMRECGTTLKRHLETNHGFRFKPAERPDMWDGEVEV